MAADTRVSLLLYYALCEEGFTEVLVVNPGHIKAVKGYKDRREGLRPDRGVAGVPAAARVLHQARLGGLPHRRCLYSGVPADPRPIASIHT